MSSPGPRQGFGGSRNPRLQRLERLQLISLGLAFLASPAAIFEVFGVTPPNHPGYVQFPALLRFLPLHLMGTLGLMTFLPRCEAKMKPSRSKALAASITFRASAVSGIRKSGVRFFLPFMPFMVKKSFAEFFPLRALRGLRGDCLFGFDLTP